MIGKKTGDEVGVGEWRAASGEGRGSEKGARKESRDSGQQVWLRRQVLTIVCARSKPESAPSLKALKASGHRLVMITGDQA